MKNVKNLNEINEIKKAKLSFYNKISESKKQKYFEYYCEMFPQFKKQYYSADSQTKELLLEKAIENSKKYRDQLLINNWGLIYYTATIIMKLSIFDDDTLQQGFIKRKRCTWIDHS